MSLFSRGRVVAFLAVFVLNGAFLFVARIPVAQALYATSSYNKLFNDTLTAQNWNDLFSDFVNTWLPVSMNGPLGIATSAPVSGLEVNGPIKGSNFSGALTGSVSAANVSSGAFGSNLGGGNFSFPANVGIGLASPGALLNVRGAAGGNTIAEFTKTDTSGIVMRINDSNDANSFWSIEDGTSAAAFLPMFRGKYSGTNAPAFYLIGDTIVGSDTGSEPMVRISGRINNGTVTNRPLFDVANVNTPYFTIRANGNTGIGIAGPTKLFEVNGQAKFNNFAYGTTPSSADPLALTTVEYVEGRLISGGGPWSRTGTTTFLTNSGDNVAIGSTNALTKLQITANNNQLVDIEARNTLRFTDADSSTTANQPIGKIEWYTSDTSAPGIRPVSYILSAAQGTSGGGNIRFGVSPNGGDGTITEPMVINGAGTVNITGALGLREANPVATRAINSALTTTNASGYGIYNLLNVTGALTAGRTNYGLYNSVISTADNSLASNTLYGNYNQITNSDGTAFTAAFGAYNYVLNNDTTLTNPNAYGTYGLVVNAGTGAITSARGNYGYVRNDTGSMLNAYGTVGYVLQNNLEGTISNAYGGHFNVTQSGVGIVTNAYGVYIDSISGGNTFGLYQAGVGNNNYFGGNLGIGATDPDARLTVAALNVSTPQIRLRSSRSAIGAGHVIGGIEMMSNDTNLTAPGTTTAGMIALAEATHTASVLTTGISFNTTNVLSYFEAMRIRGSGNVGIGTTNPTKLLEVNGQAKFNSFAYGTTPIATDTLALTTVEYVNAKTGGAGGVGSGTTGQTLRHDGTGWVANSTLYNNGTNVGIGTTSPGSNLTVAGTVSMGPSANFTIAANGRITMGSSAPDVTIGGTQYLSFSSGGTLANVSTIIHGDPLLVSGTGKIRIGGDAGAKVSIINNNNAATAVLALKGIASQSANYFEIIDSSSADVFTIDSSGSIRKRNLAQGSEHSIVSYYGDVLTAGTAGQGVSANFFSDNGSNSKTEYGNLTFVAPTLSGGNPVADFVINLRNGAIAPAEKMRVTAGGNVGIGITNPTKLLEVNGQAKFNNFAYGTTPSFTDPLAITTVEYVEGRLISGGGPWSKSGSSTFLTTNTDNVGIGITNPAAKLEVVGGSLFGGNVRLYNASRITIDKSTTSSAAGGGYFEFINGTGVTVGITDNSDTNHLIFKTRPTDNIERERMRIASGGNVGIGITNPRTNLNVAALVSDNSIMSPGTASGLLSLMAVDKAYGLFAGVRSSTGDAWMQVGRSDGTATAYHLLLQPNGGNVGIGTTNPASKLDVAGDIRIASGSFIRNTNSFNSIELYNATDASMNFTMGHTTVGYFTFKSSGGELMRLTRVGNLGIGTTNPTKLLEINGQAKFNSFAYGTTPISTDTLALTTVEYVNAKTGGSGGVGAGMTGQTLRHDGTGWVANSTLYNNGTNVGVGATAPTSKLEISAISPQLTISDTGNNYNANNIQATLYFNGRWFNGQSNPSADAYGDAAIRSFKDISDGTGGSGLSFWSSGHGAGGLTEWMRINRYGNVGIGTTNPTQKLHVVGNVQVELGNMVYFRDTSTYINEGSGLNIVAGSGRSINLAGGTGTDMTIASAGNVGIGIVGPTKLLEVNGQGKFNSFAYGVTPISTDTLALATVEYVEGRMVGGGGPWSRTGTRTYLTTNSDNVGIGTTNPVAKLDIYGTQPGVIIHSNGRLTIDKGTTSYAGGGYFEFINSNPGITIGITDNSDSNHILFKTRPADNIERERMRITSGGNVGIGTTNPGNYSLKVVGNVAITGTLETQTGSDFAEDFRSQEVLEPGTVVIMGDEGYKSVKMSRKAHDTQVVGVVSDNPSIIAGRSAEKNGHQAIVAMVGVVKVKVTDANGSIRRGDLLTSAALAGHAMKTDGSRPGTIIGKALEDLNGKTGEIKVLINLQ